MMALPAIAAPPVAMLAAVIAAPATAPAPKLPAPLIAPKLAPVTMPEIIDGTLLTRNSNIKAMTNITASSCEVTPSLICA
ncbi:hypothetical protein G6F50_018584 [Rhizopus delemar]|uniref:Secreted protein n=1 Tax=Rhizopus delemar TaxID=936053 RepID=A0A9P7BZ39_9FUNG|nr:hypothetical protein G6F50_018584 [Rhizopus delemar]